MPDLRQTGLDPAVQGVPVKNKLSVNHVCYFFELSRHTQVFFLDSRFVSKLSCFIRKKCREIIRKVYVCLKGTKVANSVLVKFTQQ